MTERAHDIHRWCKRCGVAERHVHCIYCGGQGHQTGTCHKLWHQRGARAWDTFARNVGIAGALCAAFDKGWDQCAFTDDGRHSCADAWEPGCNLPGRNLP